MGLNWSEIIVTFYTNFFILNFLFTNRLHLLCKYGRLPLYSFVSVIPDNATLVIPDVPVIEQPSLKLQEHFNIGDKSENLQFINLCMENGLFVNRASKYDTWFQMACAIKNTFGEDGYDVFTRFSKLCKKYDKYEFENKEIWDNLKCDGELTMGSIKYWAKMEMKIYIIKLM